MWPNIIKIKASNVNAGRNIVSSLGISPVHELASSNLSHESIFISSRNFRIKLKFLLSLAFCDFPCQIIISDINLFFYFPSVFSNHKTRLFLLLKSFNCLLFFSLYLVCVCYFISLNLGFITI
nr:MAG TPA: hypothetical protein [Caudoviricetes sp.]